jgi:two-component sensor histidine kinase
MTKNVTHRTHKSTFELLDFLVFIFSKHENKTRAMAILIKDERFATVYQSKSYDSIVANYPKIQPVVSDIVTDGIVGYHHIDLFDIYSCTVSRFENSVSIFCVVVIETPTDRCKELLKRYCHDIHEPLRSISNFLQLLADRPTIKADDESAKYVSYAIDNVHKLKKWIQDILYAPSKMTNEQNGEYSLSHIIKRIELLLSYQIERRKCTIYADDIIIFTNGCEAQILRLFKNLIENSLKHAKTTGDLIIKIYRKPTTASDSSITILFEDNGFQKCSHTKNKERLGLLICSELAQRNGWHVKMVVDHRYKYEIVFPTVKEH